MKYTLILLTLCFAMSRSIAQHRNFLERMVGTWHATGTAFNMPAEVDMTWTPALNGRYTQIQYKIIMHTSKGTDQSFEGTAFYKQDGENKFKATWFDSGGDMHPITASNDEQTLTSLWGTPETKMGKTLYKLITDQTVEVIDFVQRKDGTWQQFGKNTLTRQ
jgi:hypothetical protein